MKKFILKTTLLLCVSLFMTSCFSTKQSCGLTQTQEFIKKAPVKTLNADVVVLKKTTSLNS
ncbi:MAG: hypothetical protein HQ471_08505 [Flavobacteriales bacterium]|jgi:hypothetical protein|nr:hypothetical protein [Flavobacteriales bacterium]